MRFYCSELPHPRLGPLECRLGPEQSRHLRKALRFEVGDRLELFDGHGGLARASLAAYEGQQARCQVHHIDWHDRPAPQLTVATAIPKGPAAEGMIEQLSQLGVDRVMPLRTERSVVHPRPQKRERFERAAIESAKQSGRLFLLEFAELHTLEQALAEPADVTLALSSGAERMHQPVPVRLKQAEQVMLLVGPEGGFTDAELAQMEAAGAEPWRISATVLRIETAATAGAAITRFLAGLA
jgi:16S rRNA (uracil1498-N3)-methyltransferase